jgi:hypothetical protein
MIAPIDKPTFANMFIPKIENGLLSKRFVDSISDFWNLVLKYSSI